MSPTSQPNQLTQPGQPSQPIQPKQPPQTKDPISNRISGCLSWWGASAILLRTAFVILMILSIGSSVLIGGSSVGATTTTTTGSTTSGTSTTAFLQPWQVLTLSATAAISVGIMSGLDLRGNADRVRRAWRVLNSAVIHYETDPNFTVQELNEAYTKAEDIISEGRTPS